MMKRKLLFPILLAACSLAYADSSLQLVFETSDGQKVSMDAQSIVMNITNGNLSVTNAESTQSFPLSALTKMYFSNSSAGIDGISIDNITGDVEVYTTDGASAGSFDSVESAKKTLSPGYYLIKQGTKTFKVKL